VAVTSNASAEQRANRFANETAEAMASSNDAMTFFDLVVPGIRFVPTRSLNTEAGNRRKRQANLPTESTRAVYDMLWRSHEQLYSRHGNGVIHAVTVSPATTGIMEQSVFAHLGPNDHVVVVDTNSNNGRSLLDGRILLPEPDVPQFGPDVWPITAVRVANARDVLAVQRWVLEEHSAGQTNDDCRTSETT